MPGCCKGADALRGMRVHGHYFRRNIAAAENTEPEKATEVGARQEVRPRSPGAFIPRIPPLARIAS
jgi:hypothetical protein